MNPESVFGDLVSHKRCAAGFAFFGLPFAPADYASRARHIWAAFSPRTKNLCAGALMIASSLALSMLIIQVRLL
ncbi:MAG: hypothetical protein WKG52_09715 [Variovorax sp.]